MIRRNNKSYDDFGELALLLHSLGRAKDREIKFWTPVFKAMTGKDYWEYHKKIYVL